MAYDAGREQIDAMNQKADYLTDQSVEATRRMKALVTETGEVGAETLVRLHEQGEQLDNIETKLEAMDADLKEAERNLNQLEKCCGLCLCSCCCNKGSDFIKKHRAMRDAAYGADGTTATSKVTDQPTSNRGQGSVTSAGTQPMIQKVLNDDRETEMDENLTDVSNMLGNLKHMAMDMGDELERQNNQLDRINNKADSNDLRLQSANTQAKRIVK